MESIKGKVSLIIPVYNGEKFLARCLDSIVSQTYANIEIIIINDGSTDGSSVICKDYSDKYENIMLIEKENSGVSDTRNIGLNKASGEFIVLADCDDYAEKEYVEHLVSIMDPDIDMGICGWAKERESGELVQRCEIINGTFDKDKALSYLVSLNYVQGYPFGKIFRTDIIRKNGIKNDKDIALFEDLLFSCEYVNHCGKVRIDTNYCDYHYVLHDNSTRNSSILSDKFNPKWISEITVLEKILAVTGSSKAARKRVRARISLSSAFYINRMFDCRYEDAALMKELKKKVGKNIFQVLFSSEGDIKWKMQALLCSISPKMEYRLKTKV
ncbi:MAG: glycosyltransferase [Saccharofermentans sp.]|nr:glycosyltransferase [Saccharofermentans sp.]